MAIRVYLDAAAGGIRMGREQIVYYFVCIDGIPGCKVAVCGNARPLDKAERLKKRVEAALAAYSLGTSIDPGEPSGESRFDRTVDI